MSGFSGGRSKNVRSSIFATLLLGPSIGSMRPLPILVVSIAVVGSGCSPTMYTPEPYHLPLHDSPGEIQVRGTLHGGAASATISGTPVPYLIAYGSGSISDTVRHTHRTWEVGVGTYVPLPDPLAAELLAGWGRGFVSGKGTNLLGTASYRIDGRLRRQFIQIDLGVSGVSLIFDINDIDVAAGLRLSQVHLSDLEYRETSTPLPKTSGLFLEPIFSCTRHVHGIGVEFSLAFSEAIRPFARPSVHDPWEFGVGLSLRPHRFFASED